MKNQFSRLCRTVVLVWMGAIGLCTVSLADPDMDPPGRVARINLAEGPVSVQTGGNPQWLSDVANRPLTSGDKVWADQNARVELHVGSTAVRLGAETGITLGTVDDRALRLQVSAGSVQIRVRALGPDETLDVSTPFAHVAVLTPGNYRIDVSPRGDEMRVASTQGRVAVTDGSGDVAVDSGREVHFHGSVAAAEVGRLATLDDLDRWAADRDRREDRAESVRYVSRDTTGYEDLDDYGAWQTVDDYGPVWYPRVAADWSPYRFGHWVWISPWGWTWVDDAPWGFAPFHYGRWVYARGAWGWVPGPRGNVPYYAPALVGWVGGFGVGIVAAAAPVAWFPLGWNEVYVPSYRVSARYVQNVNITNIHVTNVAVVNEYYDRARAGQGHEFRPQEYRNFAVNGAVIATTRSAFASGQAVHAHPAELPHVDHPRIETTAPAVPPGAASYGRPAGVSPRPEIFNRPTGTIPLPPIGPSGSPRPVPPRTPDYRPAAPAAAVPAVTPTPTPMPRQPVPHNEWRPAPDAARPSPPVERPTEYPASPAYRPTPVQVPSQRQAPPPEGRPAPEAAPPVYESRPPAQPVPEYHPAPSAVPREAPRPPAAPPPPPKPAAPSQKEKRDERGDRPH